VIGVITALRPINCILSATHCKFGAIAPFRSKEEGYAASPFSVFLPQTGPLALPAVVLLGKPVSAFIASRVSLIAHVITWTLQRSE